MTVTLIIVLAVWLAAVTVIVTINHVTELSRRRDREIVRRIHTYLAQIPPSRPW